MNELEKPFKLQNAFWDEFRSWWNNEGSCKSIEERYEERQKRWNEFKDRMVKEGRITAFFARTSLNP